jgi:Ca-activated chloride channel family protein
MFSFEHIEYLIGLAILIPLIFLFITVLLWKKKVKKALGDDKLISQLTKTYSERRYWLKFILLCASIAFLIIRRGKFEKTCYRR